MESTSAPRSNLGAARFKSAASALYSDNQSLILEIRKATAMMKDVAAALERDNESQMVKELEDAVVQLLEASEDCTTFSSAVQSVGNAYKSGQEPTDFKKLFDNEIAKLKAMSSSIPRRHQSLRQFREAVWNVHHAGQPMPGEEEEDIVMTSTHSTLLNTTCPLSGKPITELADPIRSMDCKHIYEKQTMMQYLLSKRGSSQCPVAGCPKILVACRVVCDPLLLIDIDELRSMGKETARTDVIEDFTALDDAD